MPHELNNIIVVTKDELIPAWYKTWEALKQTLHRYKDKDNGIKRYSRSSPGHQMLILFDSLPMDIQQALGDPRKLRTHPFERFFKIDSEAVSFYAKYNFDDGSYLKFNTQEQYIINASVLKAAIVQRGVMASNKRSRFEDQYETLCSYVNSYQKVLTCKKYSAHTLPTNERRFNQALKTFETNGYVSLIKGTHKNQNSRKVNDETLNLMNSLFAGDSAKPTATAVHRRYDLFISGKLDIINNNTGELYDPAAFKKLSDATVKAYLARWVNKIGTHAVRSGDRQKYMQQFKAYHSLDRPKYAGSIISIDDRQPPFKALNGKRIWFYNGIDLGSEAFICWVYGETKEGLIINFYRQLLRNYFKWGINLPAELECEMSLNSSFANTFLREGVMFEHVRIEANNARGKRIERYFKTLRYELEKDRKGWLARPFALKESNQAGAENVPMLPYDDIIQNSLADIQAWNNMPHSVHTHMSRWQVFLEKQNPNIKPTNYLAILRHLGKKTETSCRVGIIHLNNSEFLLGIDGVVALGDPLIDLMKRVEGKQVEVYWLDDENREVLKALVFIADQFICEAVAKPVYNRAKIEQTPEDHLNRQTMSAYVATIEAFGKRQKKAIDKVTLIDNRPARKKDFIMPELKQYNPNTLPDTVALPALPVADDFETIQPRSFVTSLLDRY